MLIPGAINSLAMEYRVQAINFTADQKLVDFVEGKTKKLNQFFSEIISCHAFMKVDKKSTANNKVTEIRLNLPGKELFAKKHSDSFEESTDLVVEALRRQLVKFKQKKAVS